MRGARFDEFGFETGKDIVLAIFTFSMPKIVLIGTNHDDVQGPKRLRKAYELLAPTHICFETYQKLSERIVDIHARRAEVTAPYRESLDAAQRLQEEAGFSPYTPRLNLDAELLYAWEYETWVSYEYQRQHPHVQFHFLLGQDLHDKMVKYQRTRLHDEEAHPLLGSLRAAVQSNDRELAYALLDRMNYAAHNMIDHSKHPVFLEYLREADKVMSERIKRIVKDLKQTDVVLFPCGAGHLFGNQGNNVYERLKDYAPERTTLPEIDRQ